MTKTALVIGAGPAGLMAADQLAQSGVKVILCDAKPSVGRKFLMAGKSGLNLTMDTPFERFASQYHEGAADLLPMLRGFDANAVQDWARGLGQEVFTGSSGRVFPKSMKASPLLRAWLARLDGLGVERRVRWRWTGWREDRVTFDTPSGEREAEATVTVLALGGASWARLGSDGQWADILAQQGVALTPFAPSNVGVCVDWSAHMAPHMGAALKSVRWSAGDLSSRGEAVLSSQGLEGSGIYALSPALRRGAALHVDLAPDKPTEKLHADLAGRRAKLRLAHWLRNALRLPPEKVALFFEMTASAPPGRDDWVARVKALPVAHKGLRPIDQAISTSGGVDFSALTPNLMLKARPGVFCAGEMIAWDAPTGGYLITACLATGRWAGQSASAYLDAAV